MIAGGERKVGVDVLSDSGAMIRAVCATTGRVSGGGVSEVAGKGERGGDDGSVAAVGADTGGMVRGETATTGLDVCDGIGNRFCGSGDSCCIPGRATPVRLVDGGVLAGPPIVEINGDL